MAIVKNEKNCDISETSTGDEICFADAYWPYAHYRAKTLKLLKCKMADGRHYGKSNRCNISAKGLPILPKAR